MSPKHLIFSTLMTLSLALWGIQAQAAAKDTKPDVFTFADQTGVALATVITSAPITVTGINAASAISVSGGKYSRNGGTFTTARGTVYNGDSIRVQHTSSASHNTTTHTVLTIGGVSDTFSSTTLGNAPDTTPDPFSFTPQTGSPLNTSVTSNTITASGIDATTAISISGGQYSVNGGGFISTAGTVSNGNTVTVRLTSSSSYATTSQATLNIGGVIGSFSVTTQNAPADTTPNPFSFTNPTGVALETAITSNAIVISGIDAPAAISISGGLYAINGGGYVASTGTVNNGDSVTVRVISSPSYGTATHATLTVGGVAGTFTVTTLASNGGFQLPPASSGNPAFTSTHFSGSANCTLCHNGLKDSAGNDVSIETDWSATMMANSARDPFWRAKVRSELNRNGHLANVINDKCTRCHAPMANFETKKSGQAMGGILDGGILDATHPRHNEAMNGVSCTVCHQIKNSPDLGSLSRFTGQYDIDGSKTIYGPYTDLFPNPMIMNTGYTPTYGPHIQSSKLCATCHNLKTPYVDDAGTVLSTTPESEFPEQMPYTEWEHSSYASTNPKSCQQCHMARANGVPISNRPMWLARRDDFAIHEFVGGNRLMLDIFDKNKQQLGVLSNNFADTLGKTQTMLNSAASIDLVGQARTGNGLGFTLKINSTTGHKLPSAYPSRRVILHVTVKNAQGQVVFESGKVNANGSVAGVDADTDRNTYEPHHELITSPDQVQVYEAIMGDNNNAVTYTLLRGMTYLKDNRLLPQGFDKATAPADVRVAGGALQDANFIGGSDQVSYQIANLASGSYTVEAELVHQPIAYSFLQDLLQEPDGEVQDFRKMFEGSSAKSSPIAQRTFNLAP